MMDAPRHAFAPVGFDELGAPVRVGRAPRPDPWATGHGRSPRAFVRGVRDADLPTGPLDPLVVTESDLRPLPQAVQRYLRFMRVLGRPRDRSLRAHLVGRFRRRPDGPWQTCDVWQYSAAGEPARLFWMLLHVGPLPVLGWDTYLRGRGQMHAAVLGVVPVVHAAGPRFDVSELVTWLNDAVLMAPSMLLGPATTWSAGPDDATFDVAVTDRGRSVSARVQLGPDGEPREFWTDDRYADLPGGLVRARWRTPVDGWTEVASRPRMTGARAVWELLDGPYCYGELSPVTVEFNVPPP